MGGILSVAAPFAYLTMAAAGLVALLATEHPVSLRGGYPIVAGIGLIGLAWIGWALPASTGLSQPAQFASPLFSIGILLIALGATRGPQAPASDRYRRMAGLWFRVIAPFAASLTVVTILPIVARAEEVDLALRVTVILAAALILIRQGILLRERIRVIGELQAVRGENERLVATLRQELAERARVQDQLLVASRMAAIGELAAGVAHEVNNPLTGVLGYSELLLEEMAEGDPHRVDVQTIWNEAMRARSIVRALRDFARPTAPVMIATDLPDLVTRALDLLRYALQRANVMIVESHDELPAIELDSQSIQQVFLNVLTNALQAMPEGGTLTVKTFRRDSDAVVRIADTGEGMDEGVSAQAFVPFFTRRQESGATGLGLSASLGLVEIHGGSIHLDSTVGVGTAVEIRLPISRPAGQALARASDDAPIALAETANGEAQST
jgi:signal transduction histidine kinase